MPILTQILKPEKFNAVELAKLHYRSLVKRPFFHTSRQNFHGRRFDLHHPDAARERKQDSDGEVESSTAREPGDVSEGR